MRYSLIRAGALACSGEAEPVRQELAQLRQAAVTALRERFERAVRDGDMPEGTDCATLARYVAYHRVGGCPGRWEPRARKRRPKPGMRLMQPRAAARLPQNRPKYI